MKLSFVPGDLRLSESVAGYVLTKGGIEVFRTRSQRAAVLRFNRMKAEMEKNGVGTSLKNSVAIPPTPERPPSEGKTAPPRSKKRGRESIEPATGRKPAANKKPSRQRRPPAAAKPRFPRRERTDIQGKLAELRDERARVSQAIDALEALSAEGSG